MNLIPTPRGSGQLNVPLMVGVELANTHSEKPGSILDIGKNTPDLVYENSVIVHAAPSHAQFTRSKQA